MRRMRYRGTLQATTALGAALGLSVLAFAEIPDPAAPPDPRDFPIVSLTFDDTHESHAWAAELLSQMGMVGTFYVNSPRIGKGGYLRLEELQDMASLGHEIGGHTLNHEELAKLSEREKVREICDDRDALLSLGFSARALAYPFNSYDASTFRIAESCGYASARAAAGISAPGNCKDCPRGEVLPPSEPYRLRTFPSYQRKMGAQTLVDAIARADGDDWLIFVFHDICDDNCSTYSIHRADFLALVDWMRLHRVRTHTVSEMVLGGPCVDIDGDGICREEDNCPAERNADQEDADGDGIGDACDLCPFDPENDADGDGVCGDVDNCPGLANPDQEDEDGDGIGDACDPCPLDPENDGDGDGVCGDEDNCPALENADQADADGDGIGDVCDLCPADPENDADGDGICESEDNCVDIANPDQKDADFDGLGDACDPCRFDPKNDRDGDGICGERDNCPTVSNADQADEDGDGIGDACEDEKPIVPVDPDPPREPKAPSSAAQDGGVGCSSADVDPRSLALLVVALLGLRRRPSERLPTAS